MHPSPLSDQQIELFQRDGFLACPAFFDDAEFIQLRDWVAEISQWDESAGCVHYRERTEAGPVLARTERFLASHSGFQKVLTAGRLVGAIAQLFAEPACVFKEKINYKLPGGGGFAPHQDAAAYHRFGSLHITCLVAVDPNTVANGCLWFAPGRHQDGLLPVNEAGCLDEELAGPTPWIAAPIEPGSVLFFSSFAPHKSSTNDSPDPRRSLYVTYGKASEGNLRDAYYVDRSQLMREHSMNDGDDSRISTIGHFQGKAVH